ncbi:hypothetical protein ACX9MO_05955 [Pseudooceanicola sp. 502str34]
MTNWFKTFFAAPARPDGHRGDPFADPQIARMSHRDLADLPLTPPPAPGRAAETAARCAQPRVQRA